MISIEINTGSTGQVIRIIKLRITEYQKIRISGNS